MKLQWTKESNLKLENAVIEDLKRQLGTEAVEKHKENISYLLQRGFSIAGVTTSKDLCYLEMALIKKDMVDGGQYGYHKGKEVYCEARFYNNSEMVVGVHTKVKNMPLYFVGLTFIEPVKGKLEAELMLNFFDRQFKNETPKTLLLKIYQKEFEQVNHEKEFLEEQIKRLKKQIE